jgi:hypothetical protein
VKVNGPSKPKLASATLAKRKVVTIAIAAVTTITFVKIDRPITFYPLACASSWSA